MTVGTLMVKDAVPGVAASGDTSTRVGLLLWTVTVDAAMFGCAKMGEGGQLQSGADRLRALHADGRDPRW